MSLLVNDTDFRLYVGDVRERIALLPDQSVDCCVTSPPYLDARPEYGTLTFPEWQEFFGELRRVVKGPALLNVGRVWRNGIESDWWMDLLKASCGWWGHLDTLVWVKPNANPIHGAVLANSHEYVLVLGKAGETLNTDAIRTEYNPETIARFQRRYQSGTGVKGEERAKEGREANEKGARPRSFFIAYVGREKGNPHPAPMAELLAEHLILLASWEGQTVLDPFMGSGTTALVARRLGRKSIGIELNSDYAKLCAERLQQLPLFSGEA